MELLRELVEIKKQSEMSDLFEELGNLGKLGLGSMVDAFKQSYTAWSRGKESRKETSPTGGKFSQENYTLGKDSVAVDGGNIKNWIGLKKVYHTHVSDNPLAAIFIVDKKPVALMIGSAGNLDSINDKLALSWDFSKIDPTDEEAASLTAGLNKKGSQRSWGSEIINTTGKPAASSRTEVEKEKDYDYKTSDYVTKFTTKKYSGFVQTVREIVPFINNLAKTFGSRLEVKLILADKVRISKRNDRIANKPNPKELKLFTDDIKTRLAKYKNSKMDTAEDAQDFVTKVFGGGLKKLKFAGSTYSVIPSKEYVGSNQRHGKRENYKSFYNGTMSDLISGKPVTMQFEADRQESDYNTLYLTVKFSKGQLIPVSMKYTDKANGSYSSAETVKF